MSFRFLSVLLVCFTPLGARVLRVCADPNNLPFSNESRQGLENRLGELLAGDLKASLEYAWWPERKSFIEKSLNSGRCDVLLGVPSLLPAVLTTKPYYRSTYVFVSRKDRGLHISSLLDESLGRYRVGIHVAGDDYAPPAQALVRRGLASNLVGFSLFGRRDEANPAAQILDAVTAGKIDIAIVWGPFAGYFAKHSAAALEITPIEPKMFAGVPFTYGISLAVRKEDAALRDELDGYLTRNCEAIQSLLVEYGVPQVSEGGATCESSQPASASLH